jgi:phage head maturation protease
MIQIFAHIERIIDFCAEFFYKKMANKTFILSDESINTQGFRVLTNGIRLDEFRKNPIMLWNHNSSWRGTKDEQLPIGRWDNIRVEGGKLLADAVLDDGDDFAKEIARKVDKGIINMCSIGFAVIEQSEVIQNTCYQWIVSD